MALFKRGGVWWYKFYFAGQPIRESSKSTSRTVAKNAEQQRRRELEIGFHNIKEIRQQRIRYLRDVVDEYLIGYKLRYRSATFATYALGHVSRILGAKLIVDIDEEAWTGSRWFLQCQPVSGTIESTITYFMTVTATVRL
jgi:hypothetical protein